MTDDIRTRIAKALWDFACPHALKADHPEPGKAFLQMADAVIRELKLKREVDDRASFRMEPSRARYVTEWVADE